MVVLETLPDLITTDEAAEYLGVDVATIRGYCNRLINPLPIIMLSRKIIRINKQYFLEWIESNRKEVK